MLAKPEYGALVLIGIRGDGVRIPGSIYKLRQCGVPVVEPSIGSEPEDGVLRWLNGRASEPLAPGPDVVVQPG